MTFEEWLKDRLFYHNSYLPKKPNDWDKYNEIIVDDILNWKEKIKEMRIKKIRRLKESGMSVIKIANLYGVSRQHIYNLLKKN